MFSIRFEKTNSPKKIPPSADLGFGKHFSDHMFVADYIRGKGWVDPRVVPYGPFQLDPGAAVFHYGQELFEGLKAFRASATAREIRLFKPGFNADRMNFGARRLCMEEVPRDLFIAGLEELLKADAHWIPTEEGTSLYLRPTLIATESFLGVRPSDHYKFFIIASPVGNYYGGGTSSVRIFVETDQIRAARGGLGATKAGANYAASLQAALRAKSKGFQQVLWLDAETHRSIEEVGTMNVFFVVGDEIITPPLEGGTILSGSTRDSAICLLRDWGSRVVERRVDISEIAGAARSGRLKEVFGTGTAAVVTPVKELEWNGETLRAGAENGPVAQKLALVLSGIQRGTVADTHQWVRSISLENR
jgi:branched-chain amino acid aminotransferase